MHSLVRAKTKPEAERVGKYMDRPILALERPTLLEVEGRIGYRHGDDAELERMDFLEFIAQVTSHIPDKGQVMFLDYGQYANTHRGKIPKAPHEAFPPRIDGEELRRLPSKGWAAMIRMLYEVDPIAAPNAEAR